MADILDDDPLTFAGQLPDLTMADSVDFEFHNQARHALVALNRFAFGIRGHPA